MFSEWGIYCWHSYWATIYQWPRIARSTSGLRGTLRYQWLCLMAFHNFFSIYVFEVKESIADILVKLPCLSDLENLGQLPVWKDDAPCHQRSSTIVFDWTGNFCDRHPWSCNTTLGSETGFICSANKTAWSLRNERFLLVDRRHGTNCLLTLDSQQTRNFLKRSWKHFCSQQCIMNFFNSFFWFWFWYYTMYIGLFCC